MGSLWYGRGALWVLEIDAVPPVLEGKNNDFSADDFFFGFHILHQVGVIAGQFLGCTKHLPIDFAGTLLLSNLQSHFFCTRGCA